MNAAADYIVNIDEGNAAQLLIDESHQRPVVIDFWADWCEPCKVLMPLLEKIAHEYQGAFLLAKVNADEQQMITQQFGVRSLPTVMVMRDGQPVDGFAGAQSEAQVREVLQKYLPKPWDALVATAQQLMAAGDFGSAIAPLRQAWEDAGQEQGITLLYAQALIESRRLDEAEQILDSVRMVDQGAHWEQLKAQISLVREAAKSPEIESLEQQLVQKPDDMELRAQLAVAYAGSGYNQEALNMLFLILSSDLDYAGGASKKSYLDIIASLGKGDPLAAQYQRKLYSLLY
ncbi:MAG: thioredoxin [Parahaliea sp.]